MKINDVGLALSIFEDATTKHVEATEQGDYKTCNKAYKDIAKAVKYLKDNNATSQLVPYLKHSSVGVRAWAASYLLSICEDESVRVLEVIAKSSLGIQSLNAEMILTEWKKGNLKM